MANQIIITLTTDAASGFRRLRVVDNADERDYPLSADEADLMRELLEEIAQRARLAASRRSRMLAERRLLASQTEGMFTALANLRNGGVA